MRTLILILLALSALCAADAKPLPRETFTLTDGRTITGTYNEEAQKLTLDGGKMSLTIAPDQIKERKPADPLAGSAIADDPAASDGKSMTAEEKAKAVAGFKEGRKQAAADVLDSYADRCDQDALDLIAKAKAWKQKANAGALTFRDRAALEGEPFDVEKILRDPLITRKTHANNNGILSLQSESVRFEKEAKDKQELAKAKRAEAQRMRGIDPTAKPAATGGPVIPAGPPGMPPGPGGQMPPNPYPTPNNHP